MDAVTTDLVSRLYREYRDDLAAVRDQQRRFLAERGKTVRAQLDDVEAEITYLLLRELRPELVVEVGTFHGWSTTWLLSALRDNGSGRLHSFDLIDNAFRNVPRSLAADRWTFTQGDVRTAPEAIPDGVDYLFVDAAHSARFARWYLANVLPRIAAGTPVSVHDVFHGRRVLPFTEGSVVLRWLASVGVDHFTASAARAPEVFRRLTALKAELGLAEPIRRGRDNPMLFFVHP